MAYLVASILRPVIDYAAKSVGPVIENHFKYLCCFSSTITDLNTEAEKLDQAIRELQARVDAATNNAENIDPVVASWLSVSDNIREEMNTILNESRNVGSGCLRIATRFTLSRRAGKTTEAMGKQRENCNFNIVTLAPRIAASRATPLGTNVYEFESRKQIEEDIMTALREHKKNMIGICGMGGIGKTTMAKRIMNRVLEEQVFDEVVIVVVSQQVDELKIQLEIGGSLGLDLKDKSSQARVLKLNDRLTTSKKILLILDDVWESLDLNDLGIPNGDESKGCTILITSRNNDVLRAMDVGEIFGMKHLSDDDAWFLFKMKAGACEDDNNLNDIAKKVARECKGLPFALATVGAALKNEKDLPVWRNALKQLRQPNPNDTPHFIAQVYNPVMVSYDKLNHVEAKSLLLCCLFPEDSNISIDHLTCISIGLHRVEDPRSLEEERDRMWTLIKSLKSRSLLLDSEKEDCVKMHDIARDVCVFISKQKGYIGGNDCTWVSSSVGRVELLAPNLNLVLLLESSLERLKELKMDNTFLEGARELKVLSMERYILTSLPKTTESLKNLRTLRLESCDVDTISVVGDLVNLEILICLNCGSLKELPSEIKRLNRLKLLDLTWCHQLQSIGRGIISSLVSLEELKMIHSFSKWEGDYGERENAGLRELELLINLTCLEIHIADPALASQNLQLSSNLERYNIRIQESPYTAIAIEGCNKNLALQWETGIEIRDWIVKQLLRDAEYLCLSGNGVEEMGFMKMQSIRRLELNEFGNVKNIVFPLLECLHLFHLYEQEEIWDAPISLDTFPNFKELSLTGLEKLRRLLNISIPSLRESSYVSLFTNLSFIKISHCYKLHNLGQFSIAGKDCLSQLKILEIYSCVTMEQVFLWNEEENNSGIQDCHTTKVSFPKLKKLKLHNLPNLTTICQGIEGIDSPLLTEIDICACPRIRSISSSTSLNAAATDDHHSYSHLFCQPGNESFGNILKELETDRNPFCGDISHALISFHGLVRLRITEYHGGKSLCTFSMAENLANLKNLSIYHCGEMVQVIEEDMEKSMRRRRLFPNMQELSLYGLPKLVAFCECNVELPSLRKVYIKDCPNMANFMLGSPTAPIWEALETDFNVGVNVLSGKIKNLTITSSTAVPFCSYEISASLFKNLDTLSIRAYTGSSMRLFTSSIAGNLVNLRKLDVGSSYKILRVIGDEEDEAEKVGNFQILRKLQELSLWRLQKLMTFWEWKGDVEWPSLRLVEISECPYLANFTLGALNTPNLASVRINYREVGGTNDVNGMLLQLEGRNNIVRI